MKYILVFFSLLIAAAAATAQPVPLAPNLIRNAYMNILDGNKPAGYGVNGNLTLEAVHPFTKGFEGPYWQKPANTAASVDVATQQTPYFFGINYMGPRSGRGGLSDGWGSIPDGKILKITGDNSGRSTTVFFPFENNAKGNLWRIKCWVKMVSADTIGFGVDAGYLNGHAENGTYVGRWGAIMFSKIQADQAQDGWFYIDQTVPTDRVTSIGGSSLCMGIKGSNIEVYIALPYVSAVDQDYDWLPSIADVLNRDGVSIHPTTQNVGIGTTDTKGYKLAVNGPAIFTQAVVKNYTSWPDYVFDSTYSLRDLTSIETFIKTNKHLPDIPSATAIQENGIDLGHMQAKLLQKVEELTLYLIDLKKENQEIKVQNGLVLKQNQLLQAQIEELKKNTK